MRIISHLQRSLLGLVFVITGLNGLLHFLHDPSFKTAVARSYMQIQSTPYGQILFALQIVCGLLLLARVFVPLTLTILAAHLFNIWMFHLFLDHSFSPLALIATALWVFTFLRYRGAFRTLLLPKIPERPRLAEGSEHSKIWSSL